MQTWSGSPSRCAPWVLLLGPGARLARLSAHLRPPTAGGAGEGPESVETLEDLGQLLCDFPDFGRIVLDSDALLLEEVGLVAAFLARRPGWHLALVGSDPGGGAPRRLLSAPRARWVPWPLDLDQIEELARLDTCPCEGSFEPAPPPVAPPPAPPAPRRPARERRGSGEARLAPELRAEIERILGAAPTAEPPPERPPERSPEPPRAEPPPRPEPGPAPLPRWYHPQVAGLVDLVQDLRMQVRRVCESSEQAPSGPSAELRGSLEGLDTAAKRLRAFARSLSYIAEPPPRGDQRIELAVMAEEQLGSASHEEGAPRFRYRSEGPHWVLADKERLFHVLDALLYVARECAGPEGTVHAECRSREVGGHEWVELSIRFPAGPLAELDLERALEPYALRRILPDMGQNALAAARGIVAGQGGSLTLEPAGEGRVRWLLRLPAIDAAAF